MNDIIYDKLKVIRNYLKEIKDILDDIEEDIQINHQESFEIDEEK